MHGLLPEEYGPWTVEWRAVDCRSETIDSGLWTVVCEAVDCRKQTVAHLLVKGAETDDTPKLILYGDSPGVLVVPIDHHLP